MKRSLRIIVTAGPTREYWDPIRFISNESTGLMGFSCAAQAVKRGHRVRLVYGPVGEALQFKGLRGKIIKSSPVTTAREMLAAVEKEWARADALIMTAAVSDFRPRQQRREKISKTEDSLHSLSLVRNPDIVKKLAKSKKPSQCVVGFCLETEPGIASGLEKLRKKNLDLVVCNWVEKTKRPFGPGKMKAALIDKEEQVKWLRQVSKEEIAKKLVLEIEQLCYPKKKKRGKQHVKK